MGEFFVNIDSIIKGADRLASIITREGPKISFGLKLIARRLMIEVMEEAVIVANQYDGFPEPFQNHVLRTLKKVPISTDITGLDISLKFDIDSLGNGADLRRAYHQGARLKDGSKLDGPYEDQPLANENAGDRHIFWEALRRGDAKSPNPKGPGMVPIPRDASWEATMKKYIEIWGEKAPEWIFIQNGQYRWNPRVQQYDIIGEMAVRFNQAAQQYLLDVVSDELRIINSYESKGIKVGFTSKGDVRNLKTGRYTNKIIE